MCKKLNEELAKGKEVACAMVEHLVNMGATKSKIPVDIDGTAYVVIVELKDNHKSDCATHNEPASPNGPCDCSHEHSKEKS